MTAIELERKIEDMMIQFAKENWHGDTNDMDRKDWIGIFSLLLAKEHCDRFKVTDLR